MKYLIKTLSPGALLSVLITGFIAHYILISDNCIGTSIASIIHHAHSLPVHKHLILLGALPIYIAVIIFGSAMISAKLGGWLEKMMKKSLKLRKTKSDIPPFATAK